MATATARNVYHGRRPTIFVNLVTNACLDGGSEIDNAEVAANGFVGEIKSGDEFPIR